MAARKTFPSQHATLSAFAAVYVSVSKTPLIEAETDNSTNTDFCGSKCMLSQQNESSET
ncbi:hypothetical protein LDENG_00288380 [Lucifuga dentata]|nr:hypothetical protein LDENG_00288380 [Lucifuga dentata]